MDRDIARMTAEDLLAHAEWMRRLARRLVRDPAEADDLAQEVWEVALHRPPQEAGPIRPWLAGVARNLARMRARSAGRRTRREQVAGEGELGARVATPDELVERVETQRLVASFVLELSEDLRTPLLLRYFEGLSSAEIGAQLELAPGTVRWRLKRGLDELRARLDRKFSGDRRRWSGLLAPLGAPAIDAATGGAGAAGGAITTTAKGVLAMKTTLKIAAVVAILLAAVIGARFAGLWGDGEDEQGDAIAAGSAALDDPRDTVATRAPAKGVSREALRATREDDPRGSLRMEGQVIDSDELPVAGALVAIDSNPPRTTTTEGDGSFWFDGLIGRSYAVEARAGDLYAGPVTLRLAAESEPVILRARPAGVVEVEVRDAATEEPVAGARVELRSALVWDAITGDDGVATLRGVGMGFLPLHVAADGYAPAASMLRTTGDSRRTQSQRVVLHRGTPVSGVVVDEGGTPIAGARVVARSASEPFPVVDPLRDGVVTDDDGRWRLEAVAAGAHRFTATHERYAAASTAPVHVGAGPELDGLRIEMIAGGEIVGEVTTAKGEPVAGAVIRAVASGFVDWRAQREAFTDAAGRFRITQLPLRHVDVIASHQAGSSPIHTVDLSRAPRAELSLVLSIEGALAGLVVDRAGEPIPQARVVVEPAGSGGRQTWAVRGVQSTLAGAGGEFELTGLPAGRYRLRAAPPGASEAALWLSTGVVVDSGTRDARIVLSDDGLVRGRVLFDDGDAPELFTISVGATSPIGFGGGDGSFEIRAPGGTHNLVVAGPDFARELVELRVDGDDVEDLGTITVERGRSISGRVLDASGTPVARAQVAAGRLLTGDGSDLYIESESPGARDTTTDDDGRFLFTGLGSGSLVVVGGKPGVGRSSSIALPPSDRSVDIDLVLQSTGGLDGIATRDGQPLAEAVIVAQPIGATASNFFTITGADGSFALDTLTPGDYLVEVMVGARNDLFMRPVAIVAGQRAEVEIAVMSGSVTLSIEARTDDGQTVPAAKIRLLSFEADAATVNQLRHGSWAAQHDFGDDVVAFLRRNAVGEPARFEDLLPGRYTACVLPLPVDPSDTLAMERLRDRMAELPSRCEPVVVDASPKEQGLTVTIPAAWTEP